MIAISASLRKTLSTRLGEKGAIARE